MKNFDVRFEILMSMLVSWVVTQCGLTRGFPLQPTLTFGLRKWAILSLPSLPISFLVWILPIAYTTSYQIPIPCLCSEFSLESTLWLAFSRLTHPFYMFPYIMAPYWLRSSPHFFVLVGHIPLTYPFF